MDESEIQKRLDAAMPWVGLYITVASAVCTLAMAADVCHGLRHKMLWFPCKYFPVNTASLTLLAVAMKLPVDLTTQLMVCADWIAKLTGLFFMITVICNFMPSFGSQSGGAILANVVGLGILVITILANLWFQRIQLGDFLTLLHNIPAMIPSVLVLLLLATIISSAITIPTSKSILESKNQGMHKALGRRRVGLRIDRQTVDEMKKHWVVVQTGNPQFMAAHSIFCVTTGVICLLSTITVVVILGTWFFNESKGSPIKQTGSSYGEYTIRILVVQFLGIVVGVIAPIFRLFFAVRLKYLESGQTISLKREFKIQAHWIQTLVEWRDSFPAIQTQNLKCVKYVYRAKWFILTLCIIFQVLIVLLSKALLLIFTFLCSRLIIESGEQDLPTRTLATIGHQADRLIQKGKSQQPQKLTCFLNKTGNFKGVREFDSRKVPSLHSQEPPNCWTLPLVTLAVISVALPDVPKHKIVQLVSCLNEALSLTKLIDKTLDRNAQLANIRSAADMCWSEVALYRKWQGVDLQKVASKCKNSKEVLQELSRVAERTVVEYFNGDSKDFHVENPLNWPNNVIASNSMYRISQTILLSYQEDAELTDEHLFDQLSERISGILAACLTNLTSVIITMCSCNTVGEREKCVREAFLLLGKTEQILEILQQYEWPPSIDHEKAACIDDWYELIELDNGFDEVEAPVSNGEQITIEMHC